MIGCFLSYKTWPFAGTNVSDVILSLRMPIYIDIFIYGYVPNKCQRKAEFIYSWRAVLVARHYRNVKFLFVRHLVVVTFLIKTRRYPLCNIIK